MAFEQAGYFPKSGEVASLPQTYGRVLNVTAPKEKKDESGHLKAPPTKKGPESRYRRSSDPRVLWGLRLCNHGRLF